MPAGPFRARARGRATLRGRRRRGSSTGSMPASAPRAQRDRRAWSCARSRRSPIGWRRRRSHARGRFGRRRARRTLRRRFDAENRSMLWDTTAARRSDRRDREEEYLSSRCADPHRPNRARRSSHVREAVQCNRPSSRGSASLRRPNAVRAVVPSTCNGSAMPFARIDRPLATSDASAFCQSCIDFGVHAGAACMIWKVGISAMSRT